LTNIVCDASLICVPAVSLTFPHNNWLSLIVMCAISDTASVEAQFVTPIVTPLNVGGISAFMIFCMLTTKINIIENPATNMIGLKIRSIITPKLRYSPNHFPHQDNHLSSKNTFDITIIGDAMINIRRKATLIALAIKSKPTDMVKNRTNSVLKRNAIVNSVIPFSHAVLIYD
jgi:hypothetical protein